MRVASSIPDHVVLHGNKLIAIFLGYKWYPYSLTKPTYTNDHGWKLHPDAWIKINVDGKLVAFTTSDTKSTDPVLNDEHAYLCSKHTELPFNNDLTWQFKVLNHLTMNHQVKVHLNMTALDTSCMLESQDGKVKYAEFKGDDIEDCIFKSIVEFVEFTNFKIESAYD